MSSVNEQLWINKCLALAFFQNTCVSSLSVLNSQYTFRLPLPRNAFSIHQANFALPSDVDIYLPFLYCIMSLLFSPLRQWKSRNKAFSSSFLDCTCISSPLPPFYITKHNLKSWFHWCLFSILPLLTTLTIQDSILPHYVYSFTSSSFHLLSHSLPLCRCIFFECGSKKQACKHLRGMNNAHLHSVTIFMLHFAHRCFSLTNRFLSFQIVQNCIQLIEIF